MLENSENKTMSTLPELKAMSSNCLFCPFDQQPETQRKLQILTFQKLETE